MLERHLKYVIAATIVSTHIVRIVTVQFLYTARLGSYDEHRVNYFVCQFRTVTTVHCCCNWTRTRLGQTFVPTVFARTVAIHSERERGAPCTSQT